MSPVKPDRPYRHLSREHVFNKCWQLDITWAEVEQLADSYDRLFPSQDALPGLGAIGNLIAAPLQGQCRRRGATVFLDPRTLEPQGDQWAFLSTLGRLSPREVTRLADRVRAVTTGSQVDRLGRSDATGQLKSSRPQCSLFT